ncbi:hypothetical protein [Roseivirga misakiensis]|uniref:Uncharacterized protein n=1 Tax=Roseivirga misakiensis TaxID=1563681 RepID=A0A1E5T0K4_9BACT|nr:hypothetical protein [Roseivirga misakiensis]OEK04885.1 hypothetical protein BFP71_15715 [Roseivirga misakiensis]
MSGNRLDELTQKFQDGILSKHETEELKGILKDFPDNPLSTYYQFVDQMIQETSVQVDQEDVFERINSNRKRTRIWSYAAMIIVVFSFAYLFLPKPKDPPSNEVSEVEINEAYKNSLEALAAISSLINEGVNDIYKGVAISAPFQDFKQLNETTKKILKDEKDN